MRKRGTSHIVVSPHDVDVLLDKSLCWACMLVAPNLHQAPINSLPWLFYWHLLNNRDGKVADFYFLQTSKDVYTMTRNTPPDYCESMQQSTSSPRHLIQDKKQDNALHWRHFVPRHLLMHVYTTQMQFSRFQRRPLLRKSEMRINGMSPIYANTFAAWR